MENRYMCSPNEIDMMSNEELRETFVVPDVFIPGEVKLVYSHQDRIILGGAAPTDAPLALPVPPELRAEYFLQRRELGVIVVAGSGTVTADGQTYQLPTKAGMYIGRGTKEVTFASDAGQQAHFYLFSAPAHTTCPTATVMPGTSDIRELGDQEHANRRSLNRYIHPDGIQSCQISMGFTQLHPGSMWNTMPAHTHERRMEAYLYFDVPEDARVIHLMGEPSNTRHVFMANEEAVINPDWSIHCGFATQAYTFVWAMAGENQDFDDMDEVLITEMS